METLMESHLMSQLNRPKSTHFALKTNLCNRTQSKQLGQANFLFPLAFHSPQFSHLAHSTFSFSDCLNQEWGLLRPILDIYGDLHHRIWPGKGLGLGSHSAPIVPPFLHPSFHWFALLWPFCHLSLVPLARVTDWAHFVNPTKGWDSWTERCHITPLSFCPGQIPHLGPCAAGPNRTRIWFHPVFTAPKCTTKGHACIF